MVIININWLINGLLGQIASFLWWTSRFKMTFHLLDLLVKGVLNKKFNIHLFYIKNDYFDKQKHQPHRNKPATLVRKSNFYLTKFRLFLKCNISWDITATRKLGQGGQGGQSESRVITISARLWNCFVPEVLNHSPLQRSSNSAKSNHTKVWLVHISSICTYINGGKISF